MKAMEKLGEGEIGRRGRREERGEEGRLTYLRALIKKRGRGGRRNREGGGIGRGRRDDITS